MSMSSSATRGGVRGILNWRSDNILIMVAAAFAGHAITSAEIVFVAWLLFRVPAHDIWVSYLALTSAGLALSPFLYWARSVREQAKLCAIVFTTGMGIYAEATAIASGFVSIRLRILSQPAVLEAAPFVLSVLAIAVAPLYPIARRRLERRR